MAPPLTARLRLSKVRRLSPAPKDLFAKKVFVVFARSADGPKLLRWGFAPGEESLVCSKSPRRLLIRGCSFIGTSLTSRTSCPARPIRAHACSGISRGLSVCGWLGASVTQGLRALGLWQHSRGAAWMLRQDVACMQRRSSANMLTA